MSKIICIASQIAGTGKTATAVSLATSFALMEKSTLLIDCDPQAVATRWMGLDDQRLDTTLYHAFMGQTPLDEIVTGSQIDYMSILPSQIDLFQVEHKLAVKPGKEMILRKQVQKISHHYDYIIIDSPPTLGYFTICAMATADWLIIPIRCHLHGAVPLNHLLDVAGIVRNELNPDLKIAGRLLTFSDGNLESAQSFPIDGGNLFSTSIPIDLEIKNAFYHGRPIQLHDIMSLGAISYLNFSVELINMIDKN